MKVLGATVLAMESLVMGFALLLATKDHRGSALIAGVVIAILLMLNAGMLKKRAGWITGSLLQFALLLYGFVVKPLFILGVLFTGLWIGAIVVGRKGEAARAALLKEGAPKGEKT